MSLKTHLLYEFGPFRIDPPERILERQGLPVQVTPKAFDILVALIQRSGHLVEKSQLIEAVWGDSFVEEGNLAVTISTLRKALGDDSGKERKYIQTVAKRGYRFVGDVREIAETDLQLPVSEVSAVPMTPLSIAPSPYLVGPGVVVSVEQMEPNCLHPEGNPPSSRRLFSRFSLTAVVLVTASIATIFGFIGSRNPVNSQPLQTLAVPSSMAEMSQASVSPLFSARTRMHVTLAGKDHSTADQLYITGIYFWNKRTIDGLRRSIEYFEQAAIQDPKNALSYAGLADAYVLLDSYGVEPSREAYPSAKAAALKSLQLDELLPEAHASLGMVLFFDEWDWPKAEREFRRAIELDPDYAIAHSWYALDLLAMGRSREAIRQAQIAHDLDPLSLIGNTEVGWAFYSSRQYAPAVETFQSVIDLDQHFARAHTRLGMVYAAQHDFGAAIREFRKAQELSGPDAYVDGLLGYALARSGNTTSAQKLLASLMKRSHREYVPSFSMALICIGLHENDQALSWLQQSFQDRSTYLVYAKTDPLLDSVRTDPRFSNLIDQMGLARATRD